MKTKKLSASDTLSTRAIKQEADNLQRSTIQHNAMAAEVYAEIEAKHGLRARSILDGVYGINYMTGELVESAVPERSASPGANGGETVPDATSAAQEITEVREGAPADVAERDLIKTDAVSPVSPKRSRRRQNPARG